MGEQLVGADRVVALHAPDRGDLLVDLPKLLGHSVRRLAAAITGAAESSGNKTSRDKFGPRLWA